MTQRHAIQGVADIEIHAHMCYNLDKDNHRKAPKMTPEVILFIIIAYTIGVSVRLHNGHHWIESIFYPPWWAIKAIFWIIGLALAAAFGWALATH